ncbi:RICIN domain-containing protein [Streptomyces sp. NPDC008343]|uniref:RICIN domain-containing protein n=1 Tax=Streptomyces sp. NPDC008343 TaxID=3364828 RepID=UPI0036F0B9BA
MADGVVYTGDEDASVKLTLFGEGASLSHINFIGMRDGLVADAQGSADKPGSVIGAPAGGKESQKWFKINEQSGWFSLINQKTGLCLDVPYGATGTEVKQSLCNGGSSQTLKLTSGTVPEGTLTQLHSANGQVVTLAGAGHPLQVGQQLDAWQLG